MKNWSIIAEGFHKEDVTKHESNLQPRQWGYGYAR